MFGTFTDNIFPDISREISPIYQLYRVDTIVKSSDTLNGILRNN